MRQMATDSNHLILIACFISYKKWMQIHLHTTWLGALHTRAWDHMTIEIYNLPFVEKVKTVPLPFDSRVWGPKGPIFFWVDEQTYMKSYMDCMDNDVSRSTGFCIETTSKRCDIKPGNHDTSKSHSHWFTIIYCVEGAYEKDGWNCIRLRLSHVCLYTTLESPWPHIFQFQYSMIGWVSRALTISWSQPLAIV